MEERAIETIMRVRVEQEGPVNALMKMDIMTKELLATGEHMQVFMNGKYYIK